MSVFGVAVAGPLFVTATSALAATVAVVVDELFSESGSGVVVETSAVFASEPSGAFDASSTTSENVDVADGASETRLQLIVPPVVQLKVVPLVCVSDTNVVFGGNASVSDTFAAEDGPLFVTVIVYVTFVPGVVVVGPSFVTSISALGVTLVMTDASLFESSASKLVVDALAVFVIQVVSPISTTSVNSADA